MSRMSDFSINSTPDRLEEAEREVARLTDHVAALRQLLAKWEWAAEDGMSCLECGACRWNQHSPECRLKAALEA